MDINSYCKMENLKDYKFGGIYAIYNIFNDKFYIGSTNNFNKRILNHTMALKSNRHYNDYLQKSWNKYGENSFVYVMIEKIEDINNLRDREQFYLDLNKSYDRRIGYNLSIDANNHKISEEVRKKIGEAQKGEKNHNYGKKASKETRKKMSLAHEGREYIFGRKETKETREKISQNTSGKNNPMYGKHHTDESRKKISQAAKGRKVSDETRQKLSQSSKGKNHTEESKRKISEIKKGHIVSLETREKISIANTGYKHTVEAKKKMSQKRRGRDNPMYGKAFYQVWMEKYGEDEANKRYLEWKEKVSPKNRKIRKNSS